MTDKGAKPQLEGLQTDFRVPPSLPLGTAPAIGRSG